MDNPNGCAPNSLLLNKIVKSQLLDLLITTKPKELIDSKKETQALLIQALKFTASNKPLAIKSDNSLKVLESITPYFKMLQTSQLPMNTNFIYNGLKTLNQYFDEYFCLFIDIYHLFNF